LTVYALYVTQESKPLDIRLSAYLTAVHTALMDAATQGDRNAARLSRSDAMDALHDAHQLVGALSFIVRIEMGITCREARFTSRDALERLRAMTAPR
jgi:hypothetical protein